jgi:hypothetical protein
MSPSLAPQSSAAAQRLPPPSTYSPLHASAVLTCILCLLFSLLRDEAFAAPGPALRPSGGALLPAAAPAPHALPQLPLFFLNSSSGRQESTAGRYLGLTFKLGTGLSNSMQLLTWCLYAGRLAGRALVLPATMPSRRAMKKQYWADSKIRDAASSGWFQVPLGSVVDLPFFAACAARAGVRVVGEEALPPGPGGATAASGGFVRYHEDVVRTLVAARDPLVVVGSIVVYNGATPSSAQRVQLLALDACLAWAPGLQGAIARLAAEAQAAWGAPLSAALAVHARLEDDLIEVHTDTDDKGVVDRLAGKILGCMRAVLPPEAAAASHTAAILLTGDSIENPKYKALLDAYPGLCVTKDSLAPVVTGEVLEAAGLDAGTAVLDYSMAAQAAVFIGYVHSSFSQRIAQDRVRRGLRTYFYNEAEKAEAACAAVEDPWRVTWPDGTVTEYMYPSV